MLCSEPLKVGVCVCALAQTFAMIDSVKLGYVYAVCFEVTVHRVCVC